MQSIAFGVIAEIISAKKGKVAPELAHITEIRSKLNEQLMDALRELCRQRTISFSYDVNKNPMFKIDP